MPTQDTYEQGIDLASLTDAPDLTKAIADLAAGVIPRSVMRFASSSERGATITTPVDGMPSWLEDVKRLEIYNGSTGTWVTPEPSLASTTSGLSVASGFSINDFFGFRQGRQTTIDVYLARTGATINATTGNIPDTVCCTLPSGWRPTHSTITGCWDNGSAHGGWVVGTDGICTLRTATDDIDNGTNLRLHIAFLKTT